MTDPNKIPRYHGLDELPLLMTLSRYCHTSLLGELSVSHVAPHERRLFETYTWLPLDFVLYTISLCQFPSISFNIMINKIRAFLNLPSSSSVLLGLRVV